MVTRVDTGRRTIGVILDRFEHRYQFALSRRLAELARAQNFNLIFYSGYCIDSPLSEESQFNLVYDLVNVNYLDGLIVSSGSISHYITPQQMAAFCRRYGKVPMVSLAMELPGIPSITIDNRAGMREAITHLASHHGCKKIAFIRGPVDHPEADQRFQGYLEALQDAGLPYYENLIFAGDFMSVANPHEFVKKAQAGCFDALGCANDEMAMDAVRHLKAAGVDVPGQVALASFDNLDMSIYHEPPLTSISQPLNLLAEKAVDTIFGLLEHRETEMHVVLKPDFIKRESCGCQESPDPYESLKRRYDSLRRYYKTNDVNVMQWRQFSQDMNSATESADIVERLSRHMDIIGIPELHLCLYQWPIHHPESFVPRYSMLMMSKKQMELRVGAEEPMTFITDKLLPEGILDGVEPYVLVIMPLVRREMHYGYIAMGLGDLEPMVYGTVREQITNTVQISAMLSERSETLEKLKTALSDLRSQEERFRAMVTELPTILLEIDSQNNITYMNQAACGSLCALPTAPEGCLNFVSLLCSADRQRFEDFKTSVLNGEKGQIMEFRLDREGRKEPWIAMAALAESSAQPGGIRLSAINLFTLFNPGAMLDDKLLSQYHLSGREKEVLRYLIAGAKYKDIADKLFIAECTVKDHVKSIYNKMGVNNKQEFFDRFKPLIGQTGQASDLFLQLLQYFLNN